jgi:hypothetical protein
MLNCLFTLSINKSWVRNTFLPFPNEQCNLSTCIFCNLNIRNNHDFFFWISAVTLSCDSSTTLQSATACIPPPPTVRSVSMRDMGTEMTPIASQEPSRTGTPVRATSPDCSRPTTPRRTLGVNAAGAVINRGECSNAELSEQELQLKTRREIMLPRI